MAMLMALAIAAFMYDRMRRCGNTDRQWEYGFLFLAGAAGACYGALYGAILAGVAPDYFALGKRITSDARMYWL